ncbi:MAG: exosome protein [Thaumarchaeota archaeon]|nr:exosome protein [Nitrososphaerota archaeon]
MANKLEVTVEIIVHATEDLKTILDAFEKLFEVKEEGFSKKNLTGHFENPITMLNAKITKTKAENFIKKLVMKIPKGQLDELIGDLENRIQNSSLHVRLGKQDLIQGVVSLQEKDVIKLKIFMPIYQKKNTLKNYADLLTVSN